MEAVFEYHGTLPVEEKPLSIFDNQFAGWGDSKGDYYILLTTRDEYAYCVPVDKFKAYIKGGRKVRKEGTVYGVKVRPMTEYEDIRYNIYDEYMDDVDFWGNIRA